MRARLVEEKSDVVSSLLGRANVGDVGLSLHRADDVRDDGGGGGGGAMRFHPSRRRRRVASPSPSPPRGGRGRSAICALPFDIAELLTSSSPGLAPSIAMNTTVFTLGIGVLLRGLTWPGVVNAW